MTPLKVFGKKLIENKRKVLWREDVLIGKSEPEDSLIEISKFKNKFYIVQYLHNYNKFNVIEMFKV